MIYRKAKTNLSKTLSQIEQDKATSDDYVKCILADPQIAAYIVPALVKEFNDMEIEDIIPCIGEATVTLSQPERLGVKISNVDNESIDEEDGKIIYDIKFPLYYNGREKQFIINVEAQKSTKKSKLGYKLENRIAYYMGRMISAQKGTEFVNSNYDDLKSVYSIWICMDTRQRDDSIIEFGVKSNLLYGSIKEIPQIDLINGALINIRTRETKNKKTSKNKLIAMLEELFSRSEFIDKKKTLEEEYGLKMSVELEGRMNEMCNVSDYWEEVALEEGKEIGKEIGEEIGKEKSLIEMVLKKIKKNKSVNEIADDLEEKVDIILPIYKAALSLKPDYDVDQIYAILNGNR